MTAFDDRVTQSQGSELRASGIDVLQLNVGLRCNLACQHCHLECSPQRTERMSWPTMLALARIAGRVRPRLVDITGGAPELNADLPRLIKALREAHHAVQVRTNLTVLLAPDIAPMMELYRDHQVALVASLPCYLDDNVKAQRGSGVLDAAVRVIRQLNALGYGVQPGLALDLVHNPGGASLPGESAPLEQAYKRELRKRHGIVFNRLLAIANMPIGRFGARRERERKLASYLQLLEDSFNPATLDSLMCRHQISVAWDGTLYDCDFNLGLSLPVAAGAPRHVAQFDDDALASRRIVTARHCFGCTAGHGSSCGGALA
jgi:radical SAM/Cys-rich protein